MDNIFPLLNWILKKTKKPDSFQNNSSMYMLNRWLSMTSPEIACIVNTTGNRWILNKNLIKNSSLIGKFYHKIIPKNYSKIKYIKKPEKEEENVDFQSMASNMEMSVREVEFLNETLVYLQQDNI